MGFNLENIVPWGRSYAEYVAMFALSRFELQQRILGCGDGPASFNADLAQQGGRVVSVDPLYAFAAEQIRGRIAATCETVLDQARQNRDDYVWDVIASVEALGRMRMAAMDAFLADFAAGRGAGRYVAGELPSLPFANGSFDLALCSHFLFLYSSQLSPAFHLQATREMLRVAGEVRVFPLLTLDGKPSPHVAPVTAELTREGFRVEPRRVPYEFQRGGNEMLVIRPG
jgi:hypothetical protein